MSFVNSILRRLFRLPQRQYTARRGTPVAGDRFYEPSAQILAHVSTSAGDSDLRGQDIPIFDQGQLGSCTANGWEGLHGFIVKKLFGVVFLGSRLMLYFCERDLNGQTSEDAGANVSDGAKVLSTVGVCPESEYPYVVSKFAQKPPVQCYTDAAKYKLVDPVRVQQDLAHLKACLAEGFPFVFGFDVYQSFESVSVARTGIVPMPRRGEQTVGGHEVEAVGHIDGSGNATFVNRREAARYQASRVGIKVSHALRILTGHPMFKVTPPTSSFIIRNSWGTGWGDGGYCYMPDAYLTSASLSSDFWTARKATYSA